MGQKGSYIGIFLRPGVSELALNDEVGVFPRNRLRQRSRLVGNIGLKIFLADR